MKQPIGFQIACVRHAANERPEGDSVRIGLEAVQETLEFVRDNIHVIKAAYRLMRREEVLSFFKAFPGAELLELPDENLRGASTGSQGSSEDRIGTRRPRCEIHDHTEPSTTDGGLI